tara:strand:+ start:4514 stop:6019 length:1506 start_codon:yes stop_codon:yes gene_type:complete
MFKRVKRNPTLSLQRISDTHLRGTLKRAKTFESPFRKTNTIFEFPLDETSVIDEARSQGVEIIKVPERVTLPFTTIEPDAQIDTRLYPFQKEGVLRVISLGGRALIGDEMGCGKTIEAIALAKHYGGRCCIVCPSYLCRGWVRECETWGLDATHMPKTKSEVPEHNVVLSYSIAAKVIQMLGKFNLVICDESHYLKNHRTKRCKALRKLVKKTKHAIFLSGTPAPNSPVELYTQLSMLRPAFFGTYTDFVHRYCGAKQSPLGFVDVSGATNKEELAWLIKRVVLIRRLKRDVLTQLPPKTRTRIDVDVSHPSMKTIRKKFKRWKAINQMEETRELIFERNLIVSELFRLTSEAKQGIVKTVVADLPKHSIVFAYHLSMLDAVEEALPNSIRIDGSTPMSKRIEYQDQFQNGEVDYAVLSMMAAGTGITMTKASTVVFAELYFVPGVLLQSEDRAHRIGQENAVDVRYIIAANTLDDHVYRKIQYKIRTVDRCVDNRGDRVW